MGWRGHCRQRQGHQRGGRQFLLARPAGAAAAAAHVAGELGVSLIGERRGGLQFAGSYRRHARWARCPVGTQANPRAEAERSCVQWHAMGGRVADKLPQF
eukprot:15454818-Alexandrium_andersonii.AAC.1